ncbi:MAG: methyltransferase domain-containing protein [Planctomycetes bacterium]|nr:methyltransferase domain-containing protein [Planctomycetota bacterium]
MTFDFNGEKYSQASTHQKEWGNKMISEFNLRGNEQILDLGCGDGVLTVQLAELVPDGHVTGIDSSLSMIATAMQNLRVNTTFTHMYIEDLAFNNQFDLIFSNAALHWVKDHVQILQKVYDALKDGGIARFNFAGDGNSAYFFKVVKEVMREPGFASDFTGIEWPWYMPELDEYRVLANLYPFSEVKVWGENADRFFPDRDAITRWIDQPSLVPFVRQVGESRKQAFRDRVVERMLAETLQPDGTCFETFRRINLWARK